LATSTLAGPQTYFPVALSLLEPGSVVPCEIWLKHDERREPVLYRSRQLPFTVEHRERLTTAGVETVWVPFADADTWTRYLEERLHQRVCDPTIPVESRAEVLISTSRSIMRDVLTEPRAAGTRERVGTVADSICDFLREPSAVAATVRMMEHDYYTYTHSLHVAVYSVALARAAGIDAPDVLGEIGRGGLMHDCGKCMLAATLINKPGRFTGPEWEQMRNHPVFGLQILHETAWPASVVHDVVHCHHERMDGSGYPQGLAGRLIPEGARITAICDAFDAMTTDRAYQRAKKGREALRIIRVDDRQKYDQTFAEVFIRMLLTR
jgi:HD-GYP domain-containing protein (c-di-GMP phosphodiesterase class II)